MNYVTLGWGEGWVACEDNDPNCVPDVDKSKWLTYGKMMVRPVERHLDL